MTMGKVFTTTYQEHEYALTATLQQHSKILP
jgi:hypothetical protein